MRRKRLTRVQMLSAFCVLSGLLLLGSLVWLGITVYKTDYTVAEVGVYAHTLTPQRWVPGRDSLHNLAAVNSSDRTVFIRMGLQESCNKNKDATSPRLGLSPIALQDSWKPAYMDISPFYSWTTLQSEDVSEGLASGLVVKYAPVYNYETGQTKVSYIAYYDRSLQGEESYQKVSLTVEKKGEKRVLTQVRYWFYDQYDTIKSDWHATPPENAVTDWGTGSGPMAADAALFGVYDAVEKEPTPGSWWYNAADGYFYYIGALAAGQITPILLQRVGLQPSNDSVYTVLDYTLEGTAQAVVCSKEALGKRGWDLDESSVLYQALVQAAKDA